MTPGGFLVPTRPVPTTTDGITATPIEPNATSR
jgi:hypothetical protein